MGDDAAAQFIKKLKDIRPMLVKEFTKNNTMMNMMEKDNKEYGMAELCCECNKAFGKCNTRNVRNHDHMMGNFIGAAHADFNLKL
jgi:hypothetical protein